MEAVGELRTGWCSTTYSLTERTAGALSIRTDALAISDSVYNIVLSSRLSHLSLEPAHERGRNSDSNMEHRPR
jgi:hypothetical protein